MESPSGSRLFAKLPRGVGCLHPSYGEIKWSLWLMHWERWMWPIMHGWLVTIKMHPIRMISRIFWDYRMVWGYKRAGRWHQVSSRGMELTHVMMLTMLISNNIGIGLVSLMVTLRVIDSGTWSHWSIFRHARMVLIYFWRNSTVCQCPWVISMGKTLVYLWGNWGTLAVLWCGTNKLMCSVASIAWLI